MAAGSVRRQVVWDSGFVVAAVAVASVFINRVVRMAGRPLSAWGTPDPTHYYTRTTWTLLNGQPHPLDPPLRYLLYAAPMDVLDIPVTDIWGVINGVNVALIWVVTPLLLFGVGWVAGGRWVGLLLAAVYAGAIVTGGIGHNYIGGSFQNRVVWVPLLAGLAVAVRQCDRPTLGGAAAVGVALGVGGLIQLTNTALLAGGLFTGWGLAGRWRQVAGAAGVGAVALLGWLTVPSAIANTVGHLTLPDRDIRVFLPLGMVVGATLGGNSVASLARLRRRGWLAPRPALAVGLIVVPLLWAWTFAIVGLPYWEWATTPGRLFMVATGAVLLGTIPKSNQ